MKKIIISFIMAVVLVGCAATNYKMARGKANEVKNGMSVAEVIAVIGLPPTDRDDTRIEWRRGNAQAYNGTKDGSIRYDLEDGRIVNVPEGGIFSIAAAERVRNIRAEKQRLDDEASALWNAQREKEDAEKAAALSKRMKEESEKEAEKTKREIEAEQAAASTATFTCTDKTMCSKAFALAQLFVSQNADQKIQVATDTIIETYNPTELGRVGIKIIKVPMKGTTEVLSITPSCHSDKYAAGESLCRSSRTRIYRAFRPFFEEHLKK